MDAIKGNLIVNQDNEYYFFYPETTSDKIIDLDNTFDLHLSRVAFTTRQKNTTYKINDKVNLKNGPLDIYLVCNKAGTTSDTDLYELPDNIQTGESFFDGTVEWTIKQFTNTDTLKIKVNTSSEWQNSNPILKKGELGLESDTNYIKVGDGNSTWNSLIYITNPDIKNKLDKNGIAAQATADSLNNNISKTYIKSLSTEGSKLIITKGDNKTESLQLQDTEYSDVTNDTSGLMTPEDKQKLDSIQNNAEVNQNAFSYVKINSQTISANQKKDTLELVPGNNISLSANISSNKVSIGLSGAVANATNATKATQDSTGQNIAETYIKSISGNNTNKLTITKGNNIQSNIIINNVANANTAATATKATQDGSGQTINSTYVKSITYDGNNLVVTKGNNTTNKIEVTNISKIYPIGSIYLSTVSTNPATLFGIGTWQALPAGRVLIAQGRADWGTTYNNGNTGGEATHTLTVNESASHNHTGSANTAGSTHTHTLSLEQRHGKDGAWQTTAFFSNGDTGTKGQRVSTTLSAAGAHTHNISINNTGGNQPHNNMQPYLVVYMWKRTA